MAEGAGLLNRYTGNNLYRGFESLPLRQMQVYIFVDLCPPCCSRLMACTMLLDAFCSLRKIMNKKEKSVVVSCVLGGALEWYSFAIYGFLASIMGSNFFSASNAIEQSAASLGAFAVGVLSRPIGALIFGYISSTYSQNLSFSISVYMMAIATFLIGVIPTYDQIGVCSTVMLLLLRVIQGLALGGGFTGTMVFLFEHAPKSKQCEYTAWSPFCLILAFILCAVTSFVLACIFSEAEMETYAWRLPYLLCIFGIFIANFIKRRLPESKNTTPTNESVFHLLFVKNFKTFVSVILMDVLAGSGFFITAIFFSTYLSVILNAGPILTPLSQIAAMSVFAVAIICCGKISDRIGRYKMMLISCIVMTFTCYPMFQLAAYYGVFGGLICQLCLILIFSVYYASVQSAICESFPSNIRSIGVATSHNMAMAIFGAYAPPLATRLIQSTGDLASPGYILSCAAIITIIGLYFLKDKVHY